MVSCDRGTFASTCSGTHFLGLSDTGASAGTSARAPAHMRSNAAASAFSPTSVSPYISGWSSAYCRRFTGPVARGTLFLIGAALSVTCAVLSVAAAAALGSSLGSRYPMTNSSSCFHALAECTASKSSVESTPAFMVMDALPPGCRPSARYLFTSYTLPLTTIQQSSSVSCFSTSAMEMSVAPGGGGTYPAAGAAAGASSTGAPSASLAAVCSAWFSGMGVSSPPRSVVMESTRRFQAPAVEPIQPPGLDAGSVGCSHLTQRSPPGPAEETCVLMRNQGLFPMPMRFQVRSRGCVLLPSSQARHISSSQFASSSQGSSYDQCAQHQLLPYIVRPHGSSCLARRQLWPPSMDTSTRVMARPPPV
mmetsp:Transcript_451/g.1854  ORF Transcript_451/g.1854 Transcript_451/m.1854 type:complete len:363 (-) Transcript_451:1274-2362(-)